MKLRKKFIIYFIILYHALYYIWLYVFHGNTPMKIVGGEAMYLFGAAVGVLLMFIAFMKAKGKNKCFWMLMLVGSLCFVVSQIFWVHFELVLGAKLPYPGWIEGLCFMQVVFYVIAIAYKLYERKNVYRSMKFLFDTAIIMSAAATVSWNFIISPALLGTDAPMLYILSSVAYSIGDLALLFGAVSLYLSFECIFPKRVMQFLSIGLIVQAAADSFYSFTNIASTYISGSLIDPLWTLSGMIIGYAGVIHSQKEADEQASHKCTECTDSWSSGYEVSKMRLLLPYINVILLLVIIFVQRKDIDSLFVGFSITIILLIIRQVLILLENQSLLKQLHHLNRDLEHKVIERTAALENANAELVRANEFKDDIIASMSHELRTPIHAVLSYVQLIEEGDDGPVSEEMLEDLQIIRRSAKRLLQLIENIMSLSKIQGHKEELQISEVNLQDIVHYTYEELYYLAKEKGLEFYVDLEEVRQPVLSDLIKLEQILNNLVANAIKFTSQGYIKIKAKTGADYFEISVEDTGIGISEKHHQYIFERFTQIDHGTRRKYGGTGIGLAIVKSLVVLLKGEIVLESRPGRGSRFIVRCPFFGGL